MTMLSVPDLSLCAATNAAFTKMMDTLSSPDETDAFDASCNTCTHFRRKPMSPGEKKERNTFGMPGYCVRREAPVVGWHRGQFCGLENSTCYENRRTGKTYHQALPLGAA